MPLDTFLALLTFAFVASMTPGPNNVMLLSSGVNFGVARTVPHMAGITLGFSLMIGLVGLGVAGLFTAWPPARMVLTWVSVAYLLWLAWKIARSAPPSGTVEAGARPLTFLQAAGFQWVNPKGWTAALTANALYAPGSDLPSVVIVVGAFAMVSVLSVSVWTVLGRGLRTFLQDRRRLRVFNTVMALTLIASLYPVLFG
ncbi:LysE family translocator [Rhodobacter sp. NTK016B]|uniref:LysE family translocator n=1 Tax=Rhodobacter sp. NTK016B TaxID=2759676 RepID=UPI001A8F064B|nr:LysE family translocator [Rhodobacter sp. NTK016B]MBN8290414.1 LysE family translocator [Rhodobacter sp. NTK016B]